MATFCLILGFERGIPVIAESVEAPSLAAAINSCRSLTATGFTPREATAREYDTYHAFWTGRSDASEGLPANTEGSTFADDAELLRYYHLGRAEAANDALDAVCFAALDALKREGFILPRSAMKVQIVEEGPEPRLSLASLLPGEVAVRDTGCDDARLRVYVAVGDKRVVALGGERNYHPAPLLLDTAGIDGAMPVRKLRPGTKITLTV